MSEQTISIAVQPLCVRLKATVRHAGASRNEGESVWVKAERKGITGYGEGCPRSYVAGDDLESSVLWVQDMFSAGKAPFNSFEDVIKWVKKNSALIDRYPSAWCATEMALLDLFSREKNCSVETLLGMDGCERRGRYTAVMGDDKIWRFANVADQYLIRGMSDFQIKINGKLEKDRVKLELLADLCKQHNFPDMRIRLDANNLWAGRPEEAIEYLKALNGHVFAVEEPVGACDAKDISRVSTATGLPVILDESLCTFDDLSHYINLPGKFIANIKVSRVGGIIRALRLIEELTKMDWPIIIGCHVGETSLLTRAALIPAHAAGKNLIAQQGAFGDNLVEHEPVDPILNFGRNGLLDLSYPYYMTNARGLWITPVENWDIGFGMRCRMPYTPDDGRPDVLALEMSDKYKINYRVWGKTEGEDVLIILHGGMGHSGWLAPLARELRAMSTDITVVAADRRGSGLNEKRGDIDSVNLAIDDVVRHIDFLKRSFKRVHLAGWCQGCQYASVAATRSGNALSSLILLTPGFFWNERFRSVISISEKIIFDMISEFNLQPDRDHACIPLPMEAIDFTFEEEWLDFIENDELKTTMVTLKTIGIMDEIQELSWRAILQNSLPVLAILAENDRITDNNKFKEFMGHMFSGENQNRLVSFKGAHAIHFEMPVEIAHEICDFMSRL